MGTETNKDDRNSPEYLTQLLKDRRQIQALPNLFTHADKLLDEEINRVRLGLFHHQEKKKLMLPEPIGPTISLQEKLFVPVKEHPDFNFVGRILGPRGMTAKELEQHTGCKIMVRGKGSMRDKAKVRFTEQEDANRGKPNWEHLSEELHVLITVEDSRNRAEMKLTRAKEDIQRLLVPAPEGEDELKKKQLLELAILNGTYRDQKPIAMLHPFQAPMAMGGPGFPHAFLPPGADGMARFMHPLQLPMRAGGPPPSHAGAPIILAPRLQHHNPLSPLTPMTVTSTGIFNGGPPPLVSPPGEGALMYNPYEQHTLPTMMAAQHAAPTVMEYPRMDPTGGAGASKMRRHTLVGVREHPYNRV